jgi:translocation and assembly module TamA
MLLGKWLYILIVIVTGFLYGTGVAHAAISYTYQIQGVTDKNMRNALESVSDTVQLKDKLPETLALLNSRAQRDIAHMEAVLSDLGYYDAEVSAALNDKKTPPEVMFNVRLNQPFLFGSFAIEGIAPEAGIRTPTFTELGLVKGQVARADIILAGQAKLLQSLNNQGYPFAKVDDPRVVIDYLTHNVALTYHATAGKLMVFGDTSVQGLKTVREPFIRNKIPWRKGERYNPVLVSRMEKNLTDTGLFSIVTLDKKEAGDKYLAMVINLTERLPRTIKGGVNYSTDERLGVALSWEHRNFKHEGENLTVTAKASAVTQSGGIVYKKPDYLHLNQSLRVGGELLSEDTDAYTSETITPSIGIERKMTDNFNVGVRAAYIVSNVTQLEKTKAFALLAFPLFATYDTRDSLYDPAKGGNYALTITPFMDTLEAHANFFKAYASGTKYFQLYDKPSMILAGRAAFGTIYGASTGDIPANERFYAGGGSSVRGYGYKKLSPIISGTPIGGSSLIELSTELRLRVTDKIGLVSFIDAGNSYADPIPDYQGTLRFGTGLGVRYYTVIAPVRFDIAVPVNPVEGEAPFQFYFSLGQAF